MLNLVAQTYSYYTTTTTTTSSPKGLGTVVLVAVLVGLVLAVIGIIAMWKVFQKAGEKGWKAIIPIYNTWVLMEISGKPGWWALIAVIPYVGGVIFLVLYIMAMLQLAKYFGKSTAFAVFGLIIFSFVGLLMLGFGDAKYNGTRYNTVTSAPLNPGPPSTTPPPKAPAAKA